jgi:Ankyrin repeats (3 copies)/Ankyrin repeats (many copies)
MRIITLPMFILALILYSTRQNPAHKPEAQAKDRPSLALQACVPFMDAWSITSSTLTVARQDKEKNQSSPAELEANLLKALADGKATATEELAADILRLSDQQRRGLKFRVRPNVMEFRFDGQCPGHHSVEFLLSNKNRDYESLLVLDKTELERAARLWQVVRQLAKAGHPPALEFKLLFVEKGQARMEDLQNVFHKIDFKKQKDYYVRFLEWEDDGLRIRDPDIDPATAPKGRQNAQMLIIVRPTHIKADSDPDGFDEDFILSMARLYEDKRTIDQIRQDNALIRSAENGDVNAVRKALKAGARINSYYIDGYAIFGSDGSGYTALMCATGGGQMEVVKLLIEEKADLNLKCVNPSHDGETALYRAVARNQETIIDLLVNAGAKGSPKQIRLGIGMRRAACRGFKLKEGEGYPNYPGNAGGDGSLEIAEVLKRGADINAPNPAGYTPLMYAANLGLVENVKFLLAHGADATLKTNASIASKGGVTALSLAEAESSYAPAERRQIVELLKAHLAEKASWSR